MTIDPIDLRTFPPVEPLSVIPETWRQTFISKYVECPRSSYLYLKYNGGAMTHPLAGGTLLHRALERYIRKLLKEGERQGHPELAKECLNETLAASPDLTVSPARFDSMRAMMFHVAEGLRLGEWGDVIAVESAVRMEVAGRIVTGRIDLAEANAYGPRVIDFKSAFDNAARPLDEFDEDDEEYVPTKEEWPGTFQLVLYATELAVGQLEHAPEGFNFGDRQEFRLRQVHPRQFWASEETMAYREAVITREALLDWRDYLTSVIEQIEAAFAGWQFPAVIGSHCDFCPASAECPIPAPMRDYRGEIRTAEDAIRAAIKKDRLDSASASLWKALKGFFANDPSPLRYGRDLELRYKKVEQERPVKKLQIEGETYDGKAALKMIVALAQEGLPLPRLEWEDYYTASVSTRLTRRTLTAGELKKEQEKGTK